MNLRSIILSAENLNQFLRIVYVMKKILISLLSLYLSGHQALAMQASALPRVLVFKCSWPNCNSSFSNEIMLHAHIKAHESCEGKIYQCGYAGCPSYFFTRSHLDSHHQHYHKELKGAVKKKIKKTKKSKKVSKPHSAITKAPQIIASLPVMSIPLALPVEAANPSANMTYKLFCALLSKIDPVDIQELQPSPSAFDNAQIVLPRSSTAQHNQSQQKSLYECCQQHFTQHSYRKHALKEHPKLYKYYHGNLRAKILQMDLHLQAL